MNSLIIPVYKNAENIPSLLAALRILDTRIADLEVVFVVDGSPDDSVSLLNKLLPVAELRSQLLLLSRNFGSYPAIRAGLAAARGNLFAVMAADLQEPPELAITLFDALETEALDVVIATRESRADPLLSRLAANLFWKFYKKFVVPEIPIGGVDVFGCNRIFRDHLLQLEESHSSLVALLFWMGFRRKVVPYTRLARQHGKSAWTFKKKYIYFKDSIFSFTDMPIKVLARVGTLGILFSAVMALIVLLGKLTGWVSVPGYSATVLTIIFFGALNLLGLGIIGTYAWRTYENTKHRPSALVMSRVEFQPSKQNRQV
ncbi:MAG: glycosyltransferase [Verrucomicrobiaceae bacterium]|nr:glycosyltransferase [Verrucomicrobiaceae bacterium]